MPWCTIPVKCVSVQCRGEGAIAVLYGTSIKIFYVICLLCKCFKVLRYHNRPTPNCLTQKNQVTSNEDGGHLGYLEPKQVNSIVRSALHQALAFHQSCSSSRAVFDRR